MATKGCDAYRAEIVASIGGQPSDSGPSGLAEHLARCPGCCEAHAALSATWARLGTWPDASVPAQALDPVRLAAGTSSAVRSRSGWMRGFVDGAFAVIVLWMLGHVVPLETICSACHEVVMDTPLRNLGFLDEFLAGCFLAGPAVLSVVMLARLIGPIDQPGRMAGGVLGVPLFAVVVLPPIGFIVGPWSSLIAWTVGCAVGGCLGSTLGRIRRSRAGLRAGLSA